MDRLPILERFEAERIDPAPEAGIRFETSRGVMRAVGHYACIFHSKLSEADADRAIEDQVAYFTRLGQEVEWKVYGHDQPPDLGARLAAHGFVASEPETLMVYHLVDTLPDAAPPAGVEIRRIDDEAGLNDVIAVHAEAFAHGTRRMDESFRSRLQDPTLALFVAYAGGRPVSSGRLELPAGRAFAGLWGGATVPAFRGRGIYRALVAERARQARHLGYRYLRVDARETSRPILTRIGFVPLTSITEWVLRPAGTVSPT